MIDEKGLEAAVQASHAVWQAWPGIDAHNAHEVREAAMRAAITAYLSTLSLGTRITLVDGTEAAVVPASVQDHALHGYATAARDVEAFQVRIGEPFDGAFDAIKKMVVEMLRRNEAAMISALETK